MNTFWLGGALDRKYLRLCAVHRLLSRRVITHARALELLAQRHSAKEMKTLRRTVALWRAA